MKFADLEDIVKKDVPLHYRNEYTASAKILAWDGKSLARKIYFVIEMTPTGKKEIKVNFLESLDCPVLPILKGIKERITELDKKGLLL